MEFFADITLNKRKKKTNFLFNYFLKSYIDLTSWNATSTRASLETADFI